MEPSLETFQGMGRLCVAWSYLEMLTERTLWGLLGLNERLVRLFVWKIQTVEKWKLIVREANGTLPGADAEELKQIWKGVDRTAKDRNIIVHGVMHAQAVLPVKPPPGTTVGSIEVPPPFARVPCWTIFMGEDKGKSFPVSAEAVRIVHQNIDLLNERIKAINAKLGFTEGSAVSDSVEDGWPTPL